tara:strand:+ start:466 stop:594 length:129 start_codon:yes stop_codon:yes gene_type:complete
MTQDTIMLLYIAAIGLTFCLFIAFVMKLALDNYDDDETDDGL